MARTLTLDDLDESSSAPKGERALSLKDLGARMAHPANALESFLVGGGQGLASQATDIANLAGQSIQPGFQAGQSIANRISNAGTPITQLPTPDVANALNQDVSGHPLASLSGNVVSSLAGPVKISLPALRSGMKAIGALKNLPKKALDEVAGNASANEAKSTENFANALARGQNIKVNMPNVNLNLIKSLPDDVRKSVSTSMADPNVINAHLAQSDLGKYLAKTKALSSVDQDRLNNLKNYQTSIITAITDGLKGAGDEGAAQAYLDARNFFKTKVIPYRNVKVLQKYIQGRQSPELTSKKLMGNTEKMDEFRKAVGQDNPVLLSAVKNQKLAHTLKKISLLSAIGFAGGLGASAVPGFHHLKEVLE